MSDGVLRLEVGRRKISIEQFPPNPAWVHLTIDGTLVMFRPEEFSVFLDFLNGFSEHYFLPESKEVS